MEGRDLLEQAVLEVAKLNDEAVREGGAVAGFILVASVVPLASTSERVVMGSSNGDGEDIEKWKANGLLMEALLRVNR